MPELPNTEPVNAHLNRDEQAQRPPLFITVSEVINLTQSTLPYGYRMRTGERVNVQFPLLHQPLKDIAVGVGGTARFECIVQAHPQPQVNWTHNGSQLDQQRSSSRHVIEYRNGVCRLTLPQAYPGEWTGSLIVSISHPDF